MNESSESSESSEAIEASDPMSLAKGVFHAAHAGNDPLVNSYLDKLRESERQRIAERDKALEDHPKAIPCPQHPEHLLPLVLEDCRRGYGGTWEASYQSCRLCSEENNLRKAGCPLNLLHCTLDNWTPPTAADSAILDRVREFSKSRRGILILCGDDSGPTQSIGTGKTHLAVAVLRIAPRGSRFTSQNGFLRALRATYNDRAAEDIVAACKHAPLLVLDEVGVSGGGRDEAPALHDVLDHRYGNLLPTILTSNLDYGGIQSTLGPRMADRFSEAATVLSFHGASHRRTRRDAYLTAPVEHLRRPPELTRAEVMREVS